MEQAPNCSVCGQVMTWKTGVSKTTGKPYAFWGCNTKDANYQFCKGKPIINTLPSVQIGTETNAKVEKVQTPTKEESDVLKSILDELRLITALLEQLTEVAVDKKLGL
jgi:hypothetical protein